MKNYLEEVMINQGKLGPVTIERFDEPTVTFKFQGTKDFFTDPILILDGRTLGKANRDSMHDKLDRVIDRFLNEGS